MSPDSGGVQGVSVFGAGCTIELRDCYGSFGRRLRARGNNQSRLGVVWGVEQLLSAAWVWLGGGAVASGACGWGCIEGAVASACVVAEEGFAALLAGGLVGGSARTESDTGSECECRLAVSVGAGGQSGLALCGWVGGVDGRVPVGRFGPGWAVAALVALPCPGGGDHGLAAFAEPVFARAEPARDGVEVDELFGAGDLLTESRTEPFGQGLSYRLFGFGLSTAVDARVCVLEAGLLERCGEVAAARGSVWAGELAAGLGITGCRAREEPVRDRRVGQLGKPGVAAVEASEVYADRPSRVTESREDLFQFAVGVVGLSKQAHATLIGTKALEFLDVAAERARGRIRLCAGIVGVVERECELGFL